MLLQMALFHSFLWLSNIPLYMHAHHIFFIHASVDGHLGCFHVLPTVNGAAMNIRGHISFQISVLSRMDSYSAVQRDGALTQAATWMNLENTALG